MTKDTGNQGNSKSAGDQHGALACYEVGYGRPPKETRFQKGASGNPMGRPKKTKRTTFRSTLGVEGTSWLQDKILVDAEKLITINTENGPTEMEAIEAVIHRTKLDALKGKLGAAKLYLDLVAKSQESVEKQVKERDRELLAYKEFAQQHVKELRQRGLTERHLEIHPEDIVVDGTTGLLTITVPGSEIGSWARRMMACFYHIHQAYEQGIQTRKDEIGVSLATWQLDRAQGHVDTFSRSVSTMDNLPKRYRRKEWYLLSARPSVEDWKAFCSFDSKLHSDWTKKLFERDARLLSNLDVWSMPEYRLLDI